MILKDEMLQTQVFERPQFHQNDQCDQTIELTIKQDLKTLLKAQKHSWVKQLPRHLLDKVHEK